MINLEIIEAEEAIQAGINELIVRLKQSSIHYVQVQPLPRREKGESAGVCAESPLVITGEKALEIACTTYKDLYTRPEYDTFATLRVPGAIVIPSPAPALLDQIQEVNRLKAAFNKVIQQIEDPLERFYVVHKLLPWFHTLQATRKIHCLNDKEVRTVNFTWGRKSSVSNKSAAIKLQQVQNRYQALMDQAASSEEREQLTAEYQKQVRIIQNMTDSTGMIKEKRTLVERPLINLYHGRKRAKNMKPVLDITQREGHMPIILVNCGKPKVGVLNPPQQRHLFACE